MKHHRLLTAMMLACALPAWSQTPPAAAASKPALTPAERAQRDADKVFHWIRLSADKPAPKPVAAAPKPAPVRTAAVAAPKPALAPKIQADAAPAETPPTLLAVADTSMSSASRVPETAAPPAPAAIVARSEPPPAPEPEPAPVVEADLRLVHRVEPEFPRQLMSTVSSGAVLVRFMVQPNGTVSNLEVLKTSHRKLSSAALEAVNQWRFAPIPAAREATVEIGFSTAQ
ncbi:energy transducer TonB [Pelomonas sp. SE-A7]|uniref:energy transducer TonB n=1 Tax=Pelomonas sp. SE-A7 TaxID=3054953 RepID=UPI00259D0375|nr:energy transducer TonB [Pelomonas sp. SE-A7]MDM4767878.1 energy transducer TonB [Pelomonas sp. SE-A7]